MRDRQKPACLGMGRFLWLARAITLPGLFAFHFVPLPLVAHGPDSDSVCPSLRYSVGSAQAAYAGEGTRQGARCIAETNGQARERRGKTESFTTKTKPASNGALR